MRAIRLSSLLLLPVLLSPAAAQDQPAPATDRVARLIADLGSDDFRIRETASVELARIGLPALAALEAAAENPDREVRYRSQRVLGLIRQHDLARRLEAFLAGREAADELPLPGWSRFRKSYGDDGRMRALFVEMQRADAELLRALEDGPRAAAEMLSQRMVQHQQTLQLGFDQLSLGQVAAALFVAAEQDVILPAQTTAMLLTQCYQPAFREAIEGSARQIAPRKMLAAIIRRSDEATAYQAMGVAFQYNLPEGLVPAERILAGQQAARSPHMAQYALMTVARLGDASHLPLVEKLLGETSLVSRMQENQAVYDVQLRDAALAAAVLLTKQDLRAYFDVPAQQPTGDLQMIFFNARVIGFPSEQQRAAVFAKWAKYKAGQTNTPAEAKVKS